MKSEKISIKVLSPIKGSESGGTRLPTIPTYDELTTRERVGIARLGQGESSEAIIRRAVQETMEREHALELRYRQLLEQQGTLIQEGDLVKIVGEQRERMQLLLGKIYAQNGHALLIHADGHAENIERPRVFGLNNLAYAYRPMHPEVLENEWIAPEQFALMADPEGRGVWVANVDPVNPTHLQNASQAWWTHLPSIIRRLIPGTPLGRQRASLYNAGDAIH